VTTTDPRRSSAEDAPPAPTGSGGADSGVVGDRWEHAWEHRAALMRIARRRSINEADAEDAVAEALVRSQENPDVEPERIGGWLTSVTMRLCVDDARDRARQPKRRAYQTRLGTAHDDHAQAVCDRQEAEWLASHLTGLPARQRRALELRADGEDVFAIATHMGVTYKVAEGLLQRARAHMRAVLATASAWLGITLGVILTALKRRTGTTATATLAAVSLTVALTTGTDRPQPVRPDTPSVQLLDSARTPAPDPAPRDSTPTEAAPPAQGAPAPAAAGAAAATEPAAPPPSGSQPLRPVTIPTRDPAQVVVGDLEVRDGGSTMHNTEQGLLESTTDCLESGLEVSTDTVGCNPQ
jgi:RNA polymerase sigma factor (sigma-70 family)